MAAKIILILETTVGQLTKAQLQEVPHEDEAALLDDPGDQGAGGRGLRLRWGC